MLTGILVTAAALAASAQPAERAALINQEKLLAAEINLAKTNKSYFYVDLKERRVELRIKGIVLKTWDVAGYSQWGRPLASGSFKIEKKEALRTPKRTNITPVADKGKNEKPKSGDLEVLEMKDMPAHFSFECEKGIMIHFKSRPKTVSDRVANFFGSLGRSIYLPIKTLLAAAKKTNFTDIQFVMRNKSDAQGIYWTAEEGMSLIILSN